MISLLLVEDEPHYAALIRSMLTKIHDTQFALAEAHSLSAALETIQRHPYDLILLDLSLPDSQELATLTALRTVTWETPIVVLSAPTDADTPLQAVQEGAQDYLVKGTFNPVALGRVIQYAIERQNIVRALHHSERKYRALVEQASDSIFITSEDGRLLDVSSQACLLLGYSRAALLALGIPDILAPPEPDEQIPPLAERLAALRAGKITRYEHRLRRQDGSQVAVEIASKLLDDGRIQAIARDITVRKLAETALHARVRQEEAVAVLSQQALAAPDLGDLVTHAVDRVAAALNVDFCKILELLPDGQALILRAGVGWPAGVVGYATVGNDPSTQAGYTLLSAGVVIVTDLPTETRFSGSPLLADHGVVSGMSVVIRTPEGPFGVLSAHTRHPRVFTAYEITFLQAMANILATAIQRQRTEDALRTSERQFRAVFDNTLAAIFSVDDTRCFTKANPAACVLLGLPCTQIIGLRIDDVIAWNTAPLLVPAWERFLANGRMAGEFAVKRRDGASRTIQLEATANVLPGQHLFSMIDMTERKRAEEYRSAQEKAEAANAAKNAFLSHMSHELRTPLNAILGFSQLLELGQLHATDRESVRYIVNAGRHLLTLINDVLDMARIEAGQLSIALEPVMLADLLAGCVELLAPAMNQRGLHLTLQTAASSGHAVLTDRQRLKQVVLNLLSNAVKYNRPGGSIQVECRRAPGGMQVRIRDSGFGIAPEQIARLFTAFDRLGAETGTVEGTGLGLVIAKQLIEAMGGRIGVESMPGTGSTFWLELPESALRPVGQGADPDEGQPVLPAIAALACGTMRTILYIEDNAASRALVARTLERRPHIRLLAAQSGWGVAQIQQQPVDLVLLDLHLPDITGDEVLRRLKADPVSRAIPVVILSADASPATITRLLDAGAYDFLTKPLDVTRFLRIVDEVLDAVESRAP